LLTDADYTNRMKINITRWKQTFRDTIDTRVKWELIKYKIRSFTMEFAKIKAKLKQNKENVLLKEILDRKKYE
jgi:hypothetical protein